MIISEKIRRAGDEIIPTLEPVFNKIDSVALYNSEKIMNAFQEYKVSDACFAGSSGYGYDDVGRECLDKIFARVFGGDSALVRLEFVNGTHAISTALYGVLAPGDTLLSVTGEPYDTMKTVIGIQGTYPGSLKYYGINYDESAFGADFSEKLKNPSVKLVYIQRSRGYDSRNALKISDIEQIIDKVKFLRPDVYVFVDNCYGEFTEQKEPCEVGADLIAGSLIKNPGGGIAPRGGYVCGKSELVERASYRLTTPGIGGECGSTLGINRLFYEGLYIAPHTTAQALKTAVFCAALLEKFGMTVSPKWYEERSDIVQTIQFKSGDDLVRFCGGIQASSPVDSYVKPIPWQMPGYDCDVVMAAGTFISGATSEISCDGPIREPFLAYMQGSLSFESGKLAVMAALSSIID